MASRKDPAAAVVAFFETAPLETAQTVLAICKDKVKRRQPTVLAQLQKALQADAADDSKRKDSK
jgi:hypothetical protein